MKRSNNRDWTLETLLVHGYEREREEGSGSRKGVPTVQPIYTSTTYLHYNAETLDRAFDTSLSEEKGETAFVYARQGNPNAFALETVMAQAEGGVGAIAFGSGMAAIHAALLAGGLVAGSKILAAKDLYGATTSLLRQAFVPLGVEVVTHDLYRRDVGDIIRAEQPDVVYVETLSNPLVKVIDLDVISAAAREVGAVSVVDSTFTTPFLMRPIEHGFDLVVHSATKYLGGHGDSTAGLVISAKRPLLDQLRNYAIILGAMLSPFDSHLIKRGLQTLTLRMERHCSNALRVAKFLQEHQAVAKVHYPGLPDHPHHELATTLLGEGRYGGLLSFELKEQSRDAVFRFMDRLRLLLPATTLGDAWSLVSYPAMSSHRNLSEAERRIIGITDGCIRLSVGIEDVGDIMGDLERALGG
ncbi:MAG: aminotransferase class I/II-fold pyridoxal phosphate-dependent enzyme [Chloroflexi bacterium]|nr:MAG: aminotransferase class I/II-fold pyridoxal phosphate-dependent enzyme [Chloroflexota bacterium]